MPLEYFSDGPKWWKLEWDTIYTFTCDVCSRCVTFTKSTGDGWKLWDRAGMDFFWIGKYNRKRFVFCDTHTDPEVDKTLKRKFPGMEIDK